MTSKPLNDAIPRLLIGGLALLFMLKTLPAYSASTGDEESVYRQRLEVGVQAFYQADWQRADSIFSQLQKSDPDHPEAYFFHSMIPFWAYFFGGKSGEEADRFLDSSGQVIEKCRKRLKEQPTDTTMILMLSGLYGYRSLVAADQKAYQTAISSGLTGYRYSKQLMRINSQNPGAWVGKGMINYMLGTVPGGLQWAVDMAGLSGDREEGFQLLEKAARSESHVNAEASMLLTYLYHREERYRDAVEPVSRLVDRYPSNPIFQYYYGLTMQKTGSPQAARQAYQKVQTINMPRLAYLEHSAKERIKELDRN